ncbi:MAG: hypothetical protein LBE18_09755 [Planctomycetaceae bacterium]|jgi:hypothetical protein|nr:hypothetical protein [Planctomycetaceae bacterium]
MTKYTLLIFGIVIFLGTSGLKADNMFMELPPCGIASTYGALLHFEQATSLETIRNRFNKLFPDSDPTVMTISQLSNLLCSFGLYTITVQARLSDLCNEQLPAIICITKTIDKQKLPVAHVLLLRQINGSTAILTDYQGGINSRKIHINDLQIMSDGVILLIDSKPISAYSTLDMAASIWTMFTSLVGIVVILSFRRNYKSENKKCTLMLSHFLTVLFFVCSFLLTGCNSSEPSNISTSTSEIKDKNSLTLPGSTSVSSEEKKLTVIYPPKVPLSSPPDSLLHFENCVKDYGVFLCGRDHFKIGEGGKKIEFEFPFIVGNKDVIIEKIDSSCSCVVSDQSIVGKKLTSASEQMLKIVMDVGGICGSQSAYTRIVTKPESPQPILLKTDVFVKQLPEVPRALQIRSIDSKKVDMEININYLRDKTLPEIELNLEQCDFADFQIKSNKLTSGKSFDIPNELQDHLLLELESKKEYTIGKYETKITLAWKEKEFSPVQIPIKIQIEPQFRLSLDRAFIGEVNPGETKIFHVRLISNNVNQDAKINVIQNVDNVSVKQENDKLIVTVKSPDQVGRFEKSIKLNFQGETESIVFPISGIVKVK